MNYQFSEKVSHLQASAIREILKFTSVPGVISFAAGNPAPEAFIKDFIMKNLLFTIIACFLVLLYSTNKFGKIISGRSGFCPAIWYYRGLSSSQGSHERTHDSSGKF